MAVFAPYLQDRLVHGRAYFTREEAGHALGLGSHALTVALSRQVKKGRLACPRRGFYLILRPEDQTMGAPDTARWIDPMMRYLGLDYRISLLRAAAFHGSSHQAAMVFQVVTPKQMRGIKLGRQQVEFVYQHPQSFADANVPNALGALKSDAGFAKIAGPELTLLDCARYLHRAAGISRLAQIARDVGGKARPRLLARLARHYENSSVRRLGYLLEWTGHAQQAAALRPFVESVNTAIRLDPASKPLSKAPTNPDSMASNWRIIVNEPVEVDP